jgi:hypothetical protein
MKLSEFEKLLKEEKFVVEDYVCNGPFSRFNHLVFDKETGRRFVSICSSDNEVYFIEVFR